MTFRHSFRPARKPKARIYHLTLSPARDPKMLRVLIIGYMLFLNSFSVLAELGINCRGSGLCPRASWNNQQSVSVIQVLRDAVWASPKSNSTTCPFGAHVICVTQSQPISVGAAQTFTLSFSGTIHEGGICLFPQQGATLNLGQIRPLVDAILDHHCTTCGSVPIHFVDGGSNDPSGGILMFNYVQNPLCDHDCISGTGSGPSSTLQLNSQTSAQSLTGPQTVTETPPVTVPEGSLATTPTDGRLQPSTVTVRTDATATPSQKSLSAAISARQWIFGVLAFVAIYLLYFG